MMAGKAAKVANGGYGGADPLRLQGRWRRPGGREEETAVVKTVTTMRRTGASYRPIAAALSDDGMLTRSGGEGTPTKFAGSRSGFGVSSYDSNGCSPGPVDHPCNNACGRVEK